eukprot:PhM_4_TR12768/c0_g1_i1/m.12637
MPIQTPKPLWRLTVDKYIRRAKITWRYDRENYLQRTVGTILICGGFTYLTYGTSLPYMLQITEDPNELLKNPYWEQQVVERKKAKEKREEEARKRAEGLISREQDLTSSI